MYRNNVTLIIATHNRHKYLSRVLDYYSDCNFKIIVTDSSVEAYSSKVSDNVHYYHFPNVVPVIKINNILSDVDTPYLYFCADDDFWEKSTLQLCIDFLEKNGDYACVQGLYVTFNNRKNYVENTPAYLHGKDLIIDDENVNIRMYKIMNNYMPLYYALHRAEYIKSFFNDANVNNITHPILVELMLTFYAIVSGKYYTIHQLSYARDHDSVQSDVDRTTLDLLLKKKKYADEIVRFKNCIKKYIKEKLDVQSNHMLEKAIAIYVSNIKKRKRKQSLYGIKKIIKHILPFFIIKKINEKRLEKLTLKNIEHQKQLGYPGVDEKTNNAWEEISSFIIKHDIK